MGFENLHKGPVLLIVDSADMVFKAPSLQKALADVIHKAGDNVRVVLAAREPDFIDLDSAFKVVPYELRALGELDAAELFLKRVFRGLTERDFVEVESARRIENKKDALAMIARHPVFKELGGHPQAIRTAACNVNPTLRS